MTNRRFGPRDAAWVALAAAVTGCAEPILDTDTRDIPLVVDEDGNQRIVVKFDPDAGLQLRGDGTLQLDSDTVTRALEELAGTYRITYRPLLPGADAWLEHLQVDGKAPTEFSTVVFLDGALAGALLVEAAEALKALPGVEYVYLESLRVPPPVDLSPPSTDFSRRQRYRRAGANGLNFLHSFTRGIRGAGIRVSDCEYGWNLSHEDLEDAGVELEPGQIIPDWVFQDGWDAHGTAVLGQMGAGDNGYGVTGMVPDAEYAVFPEWTDAVGGRRAEAIASAVSMSQPGDVVILEMQTVGAYGNYAPAEYDPVVWDVVRAATDAGVVVVAAAGNGAEDLDRPAYQEYRDRGDSGAIIVGASHSASRNRIYFSTYGERVDVHAWGENVVTTGYGDLAIFGGDRNQDYTAYFSGTSSATPLVSAAVVALQSYAEATYGSRMSPVEIRDILIATGTPQADPQNGDIGPLPEMAGALAAVDALFADDPGDPGDPGDGDPILEDGVAVTGLAARRGEALTYNVVVPAGASALTVTLAGGTGDADLYVRHGSEPTDTLYDCRPYTSGNAEVCEFAAPAEGTWHVRVQAFRAFGGVSLTATLD